jgi:hypothetical protein
VDVVKLKKILKKLFFVLNKNNKPSIENPRSGGISTGSGGYLTGSVPHDHSLIQISLFLFQLFILSYRILPPVHVIFGSRCSRNAYFNGNIRLNCNLAIHPVKPCSGGVVSFLPTYITLGLSNCISICCV